MAPAPAITAHNAPATPRARALLGTLMALRVYILTVHELIGIIPFGIGVAIYGF